MPPPLALLIWVVLLLGLLIWDPAKDSKVSAALWVPLVWMFIVGSRLPAVWLGGGVGMAEAQAQAQAFEEGNPLDRTIFFVLILLAIGILVKRSFNWGDFIFRNMALVAFILFALLSVLWSDFPLVSFKRWYRDLGNYLVILVVLSDPHPLEAVRTLLRRLGYLLIPLSIVFVKYFPSLGRHYNEWTGLGEYVGVATSKNVLGALCLVSGVFFFWDTVTRWSDRKERRIRKIIAVNVAFFGMTLWLLNLASSATSSVCLVIGCVVIVLARSGWAKRHPGIIKTLIPAAFCLYLILAFGFNVNGELAGAVGRNPTLTDRTIIWKLVLDMHTNPLVGTGYQSFWLGSRLQTISGLYAPINEAHNGYLEIYLNLGLIGVILLVGFLLTSYRNICKKLTLFSSLASLSLALWAVILFYNMTEAAFTGGLLFNTFMLGAIAVPTRVAERSHHASVIGNAGITGRRDLQEGWTSPTRPRVEVGSQSAPLKGKAGVDWKLAPRK